MTQFIVRDATADDAPRLAFYRRHGLVVAGDAASPDCHLTLRRELKAGDG